MLVERWGVFSNYVKHTDRHGEGCCASESRVSDQCRGLCAMFCVYNDCAIMRLHLIHICRAYISSANQNHAESYHILSDGSKLWCMSSYLGSPLLFLLVIVKCDI